jgi:hypothetical protein
VDRETFSAWLNLLGRANEVGGVISNHASHPWRGCKFTSRSLSMADDIRYHFDTLVNAFEKIETSARPLIDDGLLPVEITLAGLAETHRPYLPQVAGGISGGFRRRSMAAACRRTGRLDCVRRSNAAPAQRHDCRLAAQPGKLSSPGPEREKKSYEEAL